MADYDVQALALATPANPSPLDTYTPAISVRNNGRFAAIATGTISAYKAGVQVFASTVQSPSIAPGETGLATATDDWTPDEETDYVFYGYVTTQLDQVEPNNNLAPVTVEISGTPPPPPVTVPAHRQQHESGGSDQLSVDGLPGVLANAQTPEMHVATHQVGGSDQLSLDGLSGQAAEAQTPDVHGNEAHNPDMASSAELTSHATGTLRHAEAVNLANRETSGDLEGLVPSAQLILGTQAPRAGFSEDDQALTKTRYFGATNPIEHAPDHELGGTDVITTATGHVPDVITATVASGAMQVFRLDLSTTQLAGNVVLSGDMVGEIVTDVVVPQQLDIILRFHSQEFTENIAVLSLSLSNNKTYEFACRVGGGIRQPGQRYAQGLLHVVTKDAGTAADVHHFASNVAGGVLIQDETNFYYELLIHFSLGGPASSAVIDSASASFVIQ